LSPPQPLQPPHRPLSRRLLGGSKGSIPVPNAQLNHEGHEESKFTKNDSIASCSSDRFVIFVVSLLKLSLNTVTIARVEAVSDDVVHGLATLLLDAVNDNAGISFMSDLTREGAAAWWRTILTNASARTVVLTARDEQGIVGTVQLQPAWAPNQPHRGDVAKLIVHRRARGRGIARALMVAIDQQARAHQFTLLVLDTCKGGAAEQLYTSLGWTRVGEIPNFALNPDGSSCDTVFFYKEL
jgi:GNAT superfamily N-acetyltransferase